MSQWFVQRMEGNVQSEVGPLRPAELLTLVRKGDVQPETLLRKDDSAWFPARDVGGLFEAALRKEVQYYCPGCNLRVREPPVTCPGCLRDLAKGEARMILPERQGAGVVGAEDTSVRSDATKKSVKSWLANKVNRKR